MRAFCLACRALAPWRIHSSSRVEGLLARLVLAGLLEQALGLLLEPGGVVALVGDAAAAVELEDPAGDVVEEVAVVGDDQDGARVGDQVLLQPGDGLGVEVVGRLVEEQDLGGLEQQLAERDAALLAAGEGVDGGVVGRAAQRLHRDVDLAVEVPEVLGVDLVLEGGHLLHQLVGIVLGDLHRDFVVARRAGRVLAATPSMTLPRTSRAGSSSGSCGR